MNIKLMNVNYEVDFQNRKVFKFVNTPPIKIEVLEEEQVSHVINAAERLQRLRNNIKKAEEKGTFLKV